MTSRQARRERREAERKNRKAESQREKAATQEHLEQTGLPSARVLANRANAQFSTGPTSELGKAVVSQNNFRHGLRGAFKVLRTESQEDFQALLENLLAEHQPTNPAEAALVEKMAQHFWLSQRAILLQETCFEDASQLSDDGRQNLALYLRYQTTHDRAFGKCSDELRKLRAERRKAEVGFERQGRSEAEFKQQEAAEKRKEDRHKWDVLLAQAAYEHQELKNLELETPEFKVPGRVERILAAERAA